SGPEGRGDELCDQDAGYVLGCGPPRIRPVPPGVARSTGSVGGRNLRAGDGRSRVGDPPGERAVRHLLRAVRAERSQRVPCVPRDRGRLEAPRSRPERAGARGAATLHGAGGDEVAPGRCLLEPRVPPSAGAGGAPVRHVRRPLALLRLSFAPSASGEPPNRCSGSSVSSGALITTMLTR